MAELGIVSDLYQFEFDALWRILGVPGVTVVALVNIMLLATIWLSLRRDPSTISVITVATPTAIMGLWLLQYLMLERPLSSAIADRLPDNAFGQLPSPDFAADFDSFTVVQQAPPGDSRDKLAVVYERIRVNNPDAYADSLIGATIDAMSARYGVDPLVLFFLCYIDSWYGEAAAGPVPFGRAMTSETVRDLVQIHLPGWFIESSTRRQLIESEALTRIFGSHLGTKLRYALQKATLDVSTAPYALNTVSDVLLVLREYPQEFDFLIDDATVSDPLEVSLVGAFERLRETALVPPYEFPYQTPAYRDSYYDANRDALKVFARAAFYKTLLDFQFASRVQALLTKYHATYYERRLGDLWRQAPEWQRASMLVMIRDLYMPNIGRVSYNLYGLPELNATPLEFVADRAAGRLSPEMDRVWRPVDYEKLWAGAGYRLRVFSEVYSVARGSELPGLAPERTLANSSKVLQRLD